MHEVRGVVQHYAWGDPRFIPDLLGVTPDGRPWAELWLGTHPNGPATLADGQPLAAVTGRLPYLLKVLAAAEPLSLQAHPSRDQAAAGFAAGRYPDPEPKPELLYAALTPFEAFCGVRPVAATLDLLDDLGAGDLAGVVARHGPGEAMAALYHGRLPVHAVIEAAAGSERAEARWATRLAERYPGDPSVAVTLLLNLVSLAPGEAISLGPGNLHAYLGGAGIELMGASDNVVRGGLTVKPVDVDDLLAVVDPTPMAEPVLPAGDRHDLPEAGVALLRIASGTRYEARGHELAVALDGTTGYLAPGDGLVAEAVTYVVTPT